MPIDKAATCESLLYMVKGKLYQLYARRLAEGKTTAELGSKIDCSGHTFKNLLDIQADTSLPVIADLCYAMNVTPDIILFEEITPLEDSSSVEPDIDIDDQCMITEMLDKLTMCELKSANPAPHDPDFAYHEKRKESLHIAIEELKKVVML